MDCSRIPMTERYCDSTDTRNVHHVIHARGSIRSPSAQNVIEEFLDRQGPNRFIARTKWSLSWSAGIFLLDVTPLVLETAGKVTTKLIEHRNVHDFVLFMFPLEVDSRIFQR